jgi:two-component system chemotaxis response regulator CheY
MSITGRNRTDVRILIVDDFTSMRKIVRRLLNSLGFQNVIEARDAGEAVQRLQHDTFDVIISDWNMPTMSGKQLLEFVRSQERLRHIPFMMLTMQVDKESVVSAKEAGVSHYLAKPFTAGELESKLNELLIQRQEK